MGDGPVVDADAITQIQQQMEERWCDEHVPAVGGLTPRSSRVRPDPTRRVQLDHLLDSFDAMSAPSGAFTMRIDRLRAHLGL